MAMPEYVTNDALRRQLGLWLQRAEDGADVIVVDRKRRRSRVRLVVVDLDIDVPALEKEGEIYL